MPHSATATPVATARRGTFQGGRGATKAPARTGATSPGRDPAGMLGISEGSFGILRTDSVVTGLMVEWLRRSRFGSGMDQAEMGVC